MQRYNLILNQLRNSNSILRLNSTSLRRFTTEKSTNENEPERPAEVTDRPKLTKFAEAFERYTKLDKSAPRVQTFASLLRNSKFVDLGDPEGKIVAGKIFHVVNDDLYIDFGWKFHCVCVRPPKNGHLFVRGAQVKLKIKDLELSSKFLGTTKDLTILEADCVLLGLLNSPVKAYVEKAPDT